MNSLAPQGSRAPRFNPRKTKVKVAAGLLLSVILLAVAAPGSLSIGTQGPPSLDRSGASLFTNITSDVTNAWVMIDATHRMNPKFRVWVQTEGPNSPKPAGQVELALADAFSQRLDNCDGHEGVTPIEFGGLKPEHRAAFKKFSPQTDIPNVDRTVARNDSTPYSLYTLRLISWESSEVEAEGKAPTVKQTVNATLTCDLADDTWTSSVEPNYIMQLPLAALSSQSDSTLLYPRMITRTDSGLVFESGFDEPDQVPSENFSYADVPNGNYYFWGEVIRGGSGLIIQPEVLTVRLLDIDQQRGAEYGLFRSGILLGLAGALMVSSISRGFDLFWHRFVDKI